MSKNSFWAAALAVVVSVAAAPVFSAPAPSGTLSGPASLAGFSDSGIFRLYVNEEPLITSDFKWKPDGSFTGSYVVKMAGQQVETKIRIEPGGEGLWQRILLAGPGGEVEIVREGNQGIITSPSGKSKVELKPATVLFENYNPALMSLAVRAYDEERGGKQAFPLFIIPRVVMEASLEKLEEVERALFGRDVVIRRFVYHLPGVDVFLMVDEEDRILVGDVPAQHAAYVREGYETLLGEQAQDSLLSRPTYQVKVEKNVMVPMRDGVRLATDIYLPDARGRFPVILVRTPYKKEMGELDGKFYARRGYVFAVQDCRGRFTSEGTWNPFFNEAADGYDTIEYLAAQPWSNGKVGMIGASYLGWVQWWAASLRPPHLVTIIPNVSPPDPYFNIPYEYGTFFLLGAIWWADVLESEATADISGEAFRAISEKKYEKLLRHLPVVELDEKVLGKVNPYWREWISHPDNDDYWARASFAAKLKQVDIPVFHQSGWFDGDGIGSKLNYLAMTAAGHKYQKLVIGPWGHSDKPARRYGERDFGEEAILDLQTQYLRWMDRWLKGVKNGIDREPLVSLFVMGRNQWLHGDTYPLPQTKMRPLYLSSGGHANTSRGDGVLAWRKPPLDVPPDSYTYDPGDPTPDPRMYIEEEKDSTGGEAKAVEEEIARRKAYYGKVDEEREDILVYETSALGEPLAIAGPVSAVLYASTDTRDIDWFIRLSEVDENGGVFFLVQGKLRARYRNSYSRPELLEPGKVYRYELDLWHTGIEVPPGRKLRVEVASACFPSFSRNLNTGGHNETESKYIPAKVKVYHDADHPSRLILPVVSLSSGEH